MGKFYQIPWILWLNKGRNAKLQSLCGQEAKKEAASTKLQEDAKAHLHSGESLDGDRLPLPKDGE